MSGGGVLAVFAHPDDESLLAGGTLAACARAGREVSLLSLTRGEAGSIADPALAAGAGLGGVRARELAAAGELLGASATECLGFPDGSLEWADADAARDAVAERIAARAPAAVVTFAPEGLYWHPDHLAAHRFVVAAVADAAAPPRLYGATWPLGLAERVVGELRARGLASDLWGLDAAAFGAPESEIDLVVDVERFLDVKLAALRAHRTQVGAAHLLHELPADLAARLLGREHFVRLGATAAAEPDWLGEVVAGA